MKIFPLLAASIGGLLLVGGGCSKKSGEPAVSSMAVAKHEHKPPHGGTPVAIGDEVYHLEFVRDAGAGKLDAFVFDGELESFIRCAMPTLVIDTKVDGRAETLVLRAVANPATGETVGDTAQFEAQAEWLKTAEKFDATLESITIRCATFTNVGFNFPRGNDKN